MATKLTPKKAAFARSYIETGNQTEAYRRSYNVGRMTPRTIEKRAGELMKDGAVTGHIAELRAQHQKRHDVTINSITQQLAEDRALAHQCGQSGAAVAATMGLAKLHGLIIERSERGKPGDFAEMSDAELTAILRHRHSNGAAAPTNGAAHSDRLH